MYNRYLTPEEAQHPPFQPPDTADAGRAGSGWLHDLPGKLRQFMDQFDRGDLILLLILLLLYWEEEDEELLIALAITFFIN